MQSKPYCPLMALMAMLCFTAATVAAPLEFCSCANEYQDGDVVHLLVDNPNGAPNLPAGSEGKILCGNNRFNGWVQVGFFGWNNGNRNHLWSGVPYDGGGRHPRPMHGLPWDPAGTVSFQQWLQIAQA